MSAQIRLAKRREQIELATDTRIRSVIGGEIQVTGSCGLLCANFAVIDPDKKTRVFARASSGGREWWIIRVPRAQTVTIEVYSDNTWVVPFGDTRRQDSYSMARGFALPINSSFGLDWVDLAVERLAPRPRVFVIPGDELANYTKNSATQLAQGYTTAYSGLAAHTSFFVTTRLNPAIPVQGGTTPETPFLVGGTRPVTPLGIRLTVTLESETVERSFMTTDLYNYVPISDESVINFWGLGTVTSLEFYSPEDEQAGSGTGTNKYSYIRSRIFGGLVGFRKPGLENEPDPLGPVLGWGGVDGGVILPPDDGNGGGGGGEPIPPKSKIFGDPPTGSSGGAREAIQIL